MHKDTARHLRYATGYLELGMFGDAASEFERIVEEDRVAPPVLDARLSLCLATKEWETATEIGRELTLLDPTMENGWIHWAYALRELGRVEEAQAVLLRAEALHGVTSSILHYNLACYFCLLGDLQAARKRLDRACKLEPRWKKDALKDPDLKALWEKSA